MNILNEYLPYIQIIIRLPLYLSLIWAIKSNKEHRLSLIFATVALMGHQIL